MKHTVLTDLLDGAAIRPPETLARFREASVEDAARFLSEELRRVNCPACASQEATPWFAKHGFQYVACVRCGSVFVSPRPSSDAVARYYAESRAGRLRVEYFAQQSRHARLEHVVQSRVDWIEQLILTCAPVDTFVDIGTLYPPLFDEIRRLSAFRTLRSFDPPRAIGLELSQQGVVVGSAPEAGASVVTAFEQLEHQSSPVDFIRRLWAMMHPGGLLLLTTRSCSGFDLQVLGGAAPYIFVPEHMNLLSIEGLRILFEREGFDLIELSTPGQLDVELVKQALEGNPAIRVPEFVRYIMEERTEDTATDFQGFLQRNRLSSHVRLSARKI